jgi:hypothetical protein
MGNEKDVAEPREKQRELIWLLRTELARILLPIFTMEGGGLHVLNVEGGAQWTLIMYLPSSKLPR